MFLAICLAICLAWWACFQDSTWCWQFLCLARLQPSQRQMPGPRKRPAVFRMDQEVSAWLAEVQLCQGTLPGWGQLNPQFHWVWHENWSKVGFCWLQFILGETTFDPRQLVTLWGGWAACWTGAVLQLCVALMHAENRPMRHASHKSCDAQQGRRLKGSRCSPYFG